MSRVASRCADGPQTPQPSCGSPPWPLTGGLAAFDTPNVRRVLVLGAVVGLACLGIETVILHLTTDPLADVHAYYDAGARLNAGLPLYEQPATTNEAEFYRYPPLLAILFRPLAMLPFAVAAAAIWMAVLCSPASSLTIVGSGRGAVDVDRAGDARAADRLEPGHRPGAGRGVTLLTALGAPWAIALGANLKVFPGLVAIWWIGRRDVRSLAWFAGWMAALIAFQFVLEPANTIAFVQTFGLGQVGEVENRSLYALSPVLWGIAVLAGVVVAWRLAPTRWGWPAAVARARLATPRLLIYQVLDARRRAAEPIRRRAGGPEREPAPEPGRPRARRVVGWAGLLWLGVTMFTATPRTAGFDLELVLEAGRAVAVASRPYDPAMGQTASGRDRSVLLVPAAGRPVLQPVRRRAVGGDAGGAVGRCRRQGSSSPPADRPAVRAGSAAGARSPSRPSQSRRCSCRTRSRCCSATSTRCSRSRTGSCLAAAVAPGRARHARPGRRRRGDGAGDGVKVAPGVLGGWFVGRVGRGGERRGGALAVLGVAIVGRLAVLGLSLLFGGLELWRDYLPVATAASQAELLDPRTSARRRRSPSRSAATSPSPDAPAPDRGRGGGRDAGGRRVPPRPAARDDDRGGRLAP